MEMCIQYAIKCKADFPREKMEEEKEKRHHTSPKNSPVSLGGN